MWSPCSGLDRPVRSRFNNPYRAALEDNHKTRVQPFGEFPHKITVAMEFVVYVVTCTLDKLMEETISQARYPFCFSKYVKKFETEKENLQSKIQEVLDRAEDAKKKTHKVVSEVEKWLNKADFLMAEVVELQEKEKKRNKTYCLRQCPNLISRYNLAKQLKKKTKEIKMHLQIEFSEFSRLATLVGIDYFSSRDFVRFDSRKVAYNGLLMALKDGKIHMIGLYGMGGSGKTTLAIEVGKEAETFFNKVVFVAMSKTFDVSEIQNKIAGQLNLELKEKERSERAKRLFMRLSGGERFLIILDDIWEKLNFKDIGIPTNNDQMSCTTTLITTRNFHVCKSMKCQEVIHLEGLNEDESWVLFQKYAGLLDDHCNNLMDVAQKITKQCGGLPIAIAAVASALKGNHNHEEWFEALKTLRDPCWIDIEEEGLKSTYGCLQLSYDNLEDKVAKSVFLLCSVYPEDYEIPIDQLTLIGLGLGLAGEFPSYRTRTQVINKAIKKLIDSCLLLKCHEDDSHVKMHDLVRDVAIWIGNKENKLIMGQLKEDVIMKEHAVRYLWFEVVGRSHNKLTCPELEFLYVSIYSKPCVSIPNDFFNGMENLRVLILENQGEGRARQLPIQVHLINNLCCLMLYFWELGDISFIGSLERLESLTICGCSFEELPKCIIQLNNLRLLELRRCKIQRSPFEVMGRCSQLEELYFCWNRGIEWGGQNKNSAEFFNKISTTSPALESYCVHFGEPDFAFLDQAWVCKHFLARSLYIEDFESCISIEKSKDMMRRGKTLYLRGIHRSCKNIIPDIWQTLGGGMNELTQLKLSDSDGIECFIGHANNSIQVRIISNLTHLALVRVNHLKTLYIGEPPQGLFANLEYLYIQSCGSLEHILTEDVKEIVYASEYQSHNNAFPKLKKLQIECCKKLEYLMPISSAKSLAHLEYLCVENNDNMRSMFGQSLHEEFNLNKPQIIEFFALETLRLRLLPNTISICPENYYPTWPILKILYFYGCPHLNITSMNVVACGELRQEEGQITSEDPLEALHEVEVSFHVEQLPTSEQVNSSLRDLKVTMLPELRHIWRGPKNSINLQNLQELELESCGNLKQVFSLSVLRCLPQLRELHIKDCNELGEIIEEDDQNVSKTRQLVFPRLATIYIIQCHKLKCVFPNIATCQVIPNLRVLFIQDASALEQVFGHEQHGVATLEYVLLWNLPSLTSVSPSIALQNVRNIFVQQCPKLSLTSSLSPHKMLEQLSEAYFFRSWTLKWRLETLIESVEDTFKESITSSNLAENKEDSEDQREHERDMLEENSVEGRAEECTALENVQMITPLAHSESTSLTNSVRDLEGQGDHEENDVKGSFEGSLSYENTEIITPSVDLKLIETQVKFDPRKENVEDLKDDGLITVLESMEDEYVGKSPILSVPTAKNELVAKALADLEESLKMPFKDIATLEANSLRLQIALNFLSRLSLEEGAVSHGVMAIIKSMHKDFPNILSSFNQAFSTVNKFAVLEERDKNMKDELSQRKLAADLLVSALSEKQKFIDEAQVKEARLKEQISLLEKERKDCEAELLSLQEQKRKYIAETVEFKKEFQTMRKEMSEMEKYKRNARQQVFQIDYEWSVISSQFELAIAKQNLS